MLRPALSYFISPVRIYRDINRVTPLFVITCALPALQCITTLRTVQLPPSPTVYKRWTCSNKNVFIITLCQADRVSVIFCICGEGVSGSDTFQVSDYPDQGFTFHSGQMLLQYLQIRHGLTVHKYLHVIHDYFSNCFDVL
jgi:hypothetical protein